LPEFDVDYRDTEVNSITEKKPFKDKKTGEATEILYFPGFEFVFYIVRNPMPKLINIFFPIIVLYFCLVCTF